MRWRYNLIPPGKKDGLYRIWAHSSIILERKSVDLRGSETYRFNEVMLDCYWNGGSPKEQSRYFDNFVISTQRIGLMEKGSAPVKGMKKSAPAVKPTICPKSQGMKGRNLENAPKVIAHENNGKEETLFDLKGNRIVW